MDNTEVNLDINWKTLPPDFSSEVYVFAFWIVDIHWFDMAFE